MGGGVPATVSRGGNTAFYVFTDIAVVDVAVDQYTVHDSPLYVRVLFESGCEDGRKVVMSVDCNEG